MRPKSFNIHLKSLIQNFANKITVIFVGLRRIYPVLNFNHSARILMVREIFEQILKINFPYNISIVKINTYDSYLRLSIPSKTQHMGMVRRRVKFQLTIKRHEFSSFQRSFFLSQMSSMFIMMSNTLQTFNKAPSFLTNYL